MANTFDPRLYSLKAFMQAMPSVGIENDIPSMTTQDIIHNVGYHEPTPVNVSPGQVVPSTSQPDPVQPEASTPAQNVPDNSMFEGTPWQNWIGMDEIPGLFGISPQKFFDFARPFIESGDYQGLHGLLISLSTGNRNFITPDVEKWLDNMISRQNTGEARDWEEQMRDTELISAGNQLTQLGLSPSGVLQTGGASHNGVAAADNVKTNLSHATAMQKYAQRMAIAKQLLSMTSSMASAGIYGSAFGAARKASGILTSAAAHSGLGALKASSGFQVSPEMYRIAKTPWLGED